MTLELLVRKVGGSLVITLPSDFAQAYNIKAGDCLICNLITDKNNNPIIQYRKEKIN